MPETHQLQIRQLHFQRGGAALLDTICLTIDSPCITAILGHNGAGKSLLLRLMHGLLQPDSGSIQWNGESAGSANVRRSQSLVFQQPTLLRRSVLANLDYVLRRHIIDRHQRLSRCQELLQSAGLASRAQQPARSLSGGQQQRLCVSRALATEPTVLMLDEPCASLDPKSTAQIEAMLLDASTHSKIYIVTHDLAQAARLAGDVVFLEAGRLAEYSRRETFFNGPASAAAKQYLNSQLHLRTDQ